MNIEQATKVCQDFADKHEIIFDKFGEVGFGRPCVGFKEGSAFIAHNPCKMNGEFEKIEEYADGRLFPPAEVKDAYHKHDCLAILGRGDKAIIQLAIWVQHLEDLGDVEIAEYENGADGIQIMFSGATGYCVRIKQEEEESS